MAHISCKILTVFFLLVQFVEFHEGKRTKKLVNYGLCQADQFRCRNEKCIKRSWFCNGINDCGDNSDESHCNYVYNHWNRQISCPTHYPFFMCSNARRCIPLIWKCDGVIDCVDKSDEVGCLDDVEQIAGSIEARKKATSWITRQRKNNNANNKWGVDVSRTAVALYFADPNYFSGQNSIGDEIAYEINIRVLVDILRSRNEYVSMNELALYIHALLVTCLNARNFHGIDLVAKLRNQVDEQGNYTSPLVLLALCNANDKMTQKDITKLSYAFKLKERPFWKSTQALALMALSCIAEKPDAPVVDNSMMNYMSLKLKKNQHNNGSFENLYTTALIMQALFSSGKEDDDWDMDEAVKYLVRSQNIDGSYGNLLNTYYVLPVLYYKSLVNISSSHCKRTSNNDSIADILGDLNGKIGKKISVKYSLWFDDTVDFVRSLQIRVLENSTFFDVMKLAKQLDVTYDFKYNLLNSKPYVYSLGGYQDDPENEKFWFLHKANSTDNEPEAINSSPVDVIPKDKDEYVMWYRSGHWTEDFHVILDGISKHNRTKTI